MKKIFTLGLTIGMIGLLSSPSSGQAIFKNNNTKLGNGIEVLKKNHFRGEASERPTSTESKLVAYYPMKHNGVEYKRQSDSVRFFSTEDAHIDGIYEDILLYSIYGVLFQAEKIPLDHYQILNIDSTITYGLNGTGTGYDELKTRMEMTKNTSGQVTISLQQVRTGSSWKNTDRSTYTYNTNNNPTEILNEEFTGSWVNDSKQLITYTSAKKIETNIELDWNAGAWENDRKDIYTYATNGDCITHITQNGAINTWNNSYKRTFTYNANHLVTEIIAESWNGASWDLDERVTYTYQGTKLLSALYQNRIGGSWVDESKRTNTYNGNKLETCLLEYASGGVLANNTLYEYTSNAITTVIVNGYDIVSSSWLKTYKLNINRNSHKQITEIDNDTWNVGDFWETVNNTQRYRFFYEDYETGINDLSKNLQTSVYPNPAKNSLNVTLNWKTPLEASLSLFDINGRTLYNENLSKSSSQQVKIDVSHLTSGIYFVNIKTKEGQSTKKVEILK